MRIKELEINHYRNLSHPYIKFSESNITAITGVNGSGKTSILDAIALLAMNVKDMSLDIKGIFEDDDGDTFSYHTLIDTLVIQSKQINLTYIDSYRYTREDSLNVPLELLEDKEVLDKFTNIARDFYKVLNKNLLKVSKDTLSLKLIFSDSSEFTLNQLGDGCRVFLSTIIELLYVEKLKPIPIVLIDELEIHLHPSLHRMLIIILKKYFSKLQFVITTNSPILISQLSSEEVRIINPIDYLVDICEYHTFGADANRLLKLVFDTDERPEDIKRLFEDFSFKVADRNFLEAKNILAKLKSIVGELDSEVLGCQVTLDLEQLDEKCFGDKHKKR